MNNYLSHLVSRSFSPLNQVRPRLPSRFEPAAALPGLEPPASQQDDGVSTQRATQAAISPAYGWPPPPASPASAPVAPIVNQLAAPPVNLSEAEPPAPAPPRLQPDRLHQPGLAAMQNPPQPQIPETGDRTPVSPPSARAVPAHPPEPTSPPAPLPTLLQPLLPPFPAAVIPQDIGSTSPVSGATPVISPTLTASPEEQPQASLPALTKPALRLQPSISPAQPESSVALPADTAGASPPRPRVTVMQPQIQPLSADPPRLEPAAPNPPTIHVSIGRIEVRATPVASTPPPKARPRAPAMNLDDYLRHRTKGGS